jgi:ASC-1-like (ASCH) protein
MAARTAIELLKALATKVGGKEVKNVFRQNLDDTFGKDEVKEGIRIITQREQNPELAKMFYKADESLEDDLVNLLETRYMGSERLMAHPLSFNRRGPGAADRYKQINDSGMRLTDLPGGPADKNLYAKHFGEMKDTTAGVSGERVYKNTRPTILDEVPTEKVDDVIEGKLVEDSLYDTSIADIPLINRMMKETGKTETEIREAIVDMANEGYESGSSKLMRMSDDDRLRAFISNKQAVPRETEEFVDDMFERLDYTKPLDTGDDILANMRKMEAEVTAMKEIAEAEQMQYGQGMDAFRRMLDDGEDPGEALEFLKSVFKRTKQAKGGRVGMALGGAAKGIMEAIKLAARGVKPFGQKQTYKQNVKNMGLSNFDQVEVVTSKQIDELRNANDVDGLFEMLEDVVSGKKFGMANPAQRKVLQENIEEALNDIPLNRDSRERLSEDYFNMMEYYKPDPKETGKVIPFKPREKKFSGGIAGLLKRIMSPRLEKEMVKTGPFQTGHRADILGDMDQIKNVSRNPKTQLPEMDALYDMVQDSPRYNEAMRAAMMKLVDYERFRAILLDDNDKLQALVKAQPELGEDLIRRLFKAGGSQPQFAGGGIVNTLAAPDATKAQQNAMTNQDLFNMNSPYTQEVMRASQEAMANPMRYQLMEQYMNSPAFKEAQERSEQFQLRQAESDQARRMAYMDAEQGLADTYAGMDDFQQVGIGLDKKMDNLGRVLGMGQQQIRQQIAQANPNQPQTGLQSQNVLNIGGLGNLFGLRS